MSKRAVVLLSGGLDSVVSLAAVKKYSDVSLALTFDYGQKAFENEFQSSKKIAQYYGIEHKYIKLDWLKEITSSSLVSDSEIPNLEPENLDIREITKETMKSVWIPNRNGLFINIAASFADSFSYDYIVIGANKEEAATFSDNSEEFINSINHALKTSTNYDIEVVAPLIKLTKKEIVEKGVELNVPLELINSCYNNTQNHCGKCESCCRLKRALIDAGQENLLHKIF